MTVRALIPLRTYSTLNQREHWGAKARRVKREREMAFLLVKRHELPCAVTLTRIGPRKLDTDNLLGALKAIRDGIADRLGIDDGDKRVTWIYQQEKGEYGVRVFIAEAINTFGETRIWA